MTLDIEPDFFEAIALGHIQTVRDWLAMGPDLAHGYSPDGFTALHLACYFDHPAIASLLLERGAEVNAETRNAMRLRPIHSATAARTAGLVQLLLQYGAEPNAQQQGGYTPLHAAAKHGDIEIVRLLLFRNADPTIRTNDGQTAKDLAREAEHDQIVQLFGST